MTSRSLNLSPSMKPPRLLYLITVDWFFISHFLERAIAAKQAGFEVLVATHLEANHQRICDAGLTPIQWNVTRRGINPISELRSMFEVLRIYRKHQPDLVHHVAMKPIIYGSLAARFVGIRSVLNAPVGMGFVYSSGSLIARALRPLLALLLRVFLNPPDSRVIFENRDDRSTAVEQGLVRHEDALLIRGAGVSLTGFVPTPEPSGPPRVVLIARMLWDKGVGEFVAAARMLKARGTDAKFVLIGAPDPGNRASIGEQQLRAWQDAGVVEWLGHRTDVADILAAAHIVTLPSYREGLPRSLLEGLAAARPIVTTDVPGCREVVKPGENGLLVPVRDVAALARALDSLLRDKALRERFGRQSRLLAEAEFGVDCVTAQTLDVYASLMAATPMPKR